MAIVLTEQTVDRPGSGPVEIVERKGLGHPDTICDALAEAVSGALSRYYREHFGLILHHNVDKALLWGGVSRPTFGGGEVVEPMEIFLAGRATRDLKGTQVPVEELVVETTRQWIRAHLRGVDVDRHVRVRCLIRPGSRDLVDLFLRQQESGTVFANDTSCGVGYAPLDALERSVLAMENHLNADTVKEGHPEMGEDVKVMAVRRGESVTVTLGCALIDLHIANREEYESKKENVADLARQAAARHWEGPVEVAVNAADGEGPDSLYLTVTGTSAEGGDDGQVGRGNRANGLITPYRPMNMEAVAGKNPVSHVGKLYNLVAQRITATVVEEMDDVEAAECYLVSRIGRPIDQPQVAEVRLVTARPLDELRRSVQDLVESELHGIDGIQQEILRDAIKVY